MQLKPLKWYEQLQKKRYRSQYGCFLAPGENCVRELLLKKPEALKLLLCVDTSESPSGLQHALDSTGSRSVAVRTITASQMRIITGFNSAPSCCGVFDLPEVMPIQKKMAQGATFVFLDRVQDPGNVGTLIRSAAAFGLTGLICSPGCADPFSVKAASASAGALFSMQLFTGYDFAEIQTSLQQQPGACFVAATLQGHPAPEVTAKLDGFTNITLVLGNEGQGIAPDIIEQCQMSVTIPIRSERVESLNVAMAGTVLLYELFACRQ